MAVGGLVEGLLGEGVGGGWRWRGLRHGGRCRAGPVARYSCRGAAVRAALPERLSRPTIAARLPAPAGRAHSPPPPPRPPARAPPPPPPPPHQPRRDAAGAPPDRSISSLIT
ncbi:hypothetical protein O0L34_g17003 [Tuta absoluta]|nr:hypothetical protein O0L34_g17003 [Tuta absoluta]